LSSSDKETSPSADVSLAELNLALLAVISELASAAANHDDMALLRGARECSSKVTLFFFDSAAEIIVMMFLIFLVDLVCSMAEYNLNRVF
jgi:hypothetical protein